MKVLFLCLTIISVLFGTSSTSSNTLKDQIARMVVVGFDQSVLDENATIVKELEKYPLGGVILFDRFYKQRTKVKNIQSPEQLKSLAAHLQKYAQKPLLISLDQEGGKVARLKPKDGFIATPSAASMGTRDDISIDEFYNTQSKMLHEMGINVNFAPVVDLAIEPNNNVIYGLERAYGETPEQVVRGAQKMIDSQKNHRILSVLKHFPGHGSSLADSHEGFVDISNTWSEKELEPYKQFITEGYTQMIMSAHVFNKHLDATLPATLSYAINTTILREKLGFKGVLISDDLQMKAISEHYNLKETLALAVNSGVDIVLFGNQLSFTSTQEIIETLYALVQEGVIPQERIMEANQRIEKLIGMLSLR